MLLGWVDPIHTSFLNAPKKVLHDLARLSSTKKSSVKYACGLAKKWRESLLLLLLLLFNATLKLHSLSLHIPPKINMEPQKWRFGRWFSFLNGVIFRFHVNFQGCTGWNSKARKGKKGRAYPSKIGCQYRFSSAGPQGERFQVGIRGCGSSWEGFLEKEKRNTCFFSVVFVFISAKIWWGLFNLESQRWFKVTCLSPVGGHLTISRVTYITIPKRLPAELPGMSFLFLLMFLYTFSIKICSSILFGASKIPESVTRGISSIEPNSLKRAPEMQDLFAQNHGGFESQ